MKVRLKMLECFDITKGKPDNGEIPFHLEFHGDRGCIHMLLWIKGDSEEIGIMTFDIPSGFAVIQPIGARYYLLGEVLNEQQYLIHFEDDSQLMEYVKVMKPYLGKIKEEDLGVGEAEKLYEKIIDVFDEQMSNNIEKLLEDENEDDGEA